MSAGDDVVEFESVPIYCRQCLSTDRQQASSSQQRCTKSESFDSDSAAASVEYTPLRLRNILMFWTPTPAQTPKSV